MWGFGRNYGEDDVRSAFRTTLAAGINFIDTAEAYGNGRSERMIGQFIHELASNDGNTKIILATKFFPYPWRIRQKDLITALKGSLKRLNLEKVDLYQIHIPFPQPLLETWATGLADALDLGLTRAVGVSNFNIKQMERIMDVLTQRGIPLASNQVEYSLYNRKIEFNGLFEFCKKNDITVIAYSPLAKGILTGKYTHTNPPPGVRRFMYNPRVLQEVQPLLQLLDEIGKEHGGKSPAQVALNWVICKGAVPIPGAKNARQAEENAGALGWRLTDEQITALNEVSQTVQSV